jgi:uncharacterized protein YecA (UPF0149 family)
MKQDIFSQLLEARLAETRRRLSAKAAEYAKGDGDRLHNFKEAADLEGSNPADALRGMLAKHWASIKDLVTALNHPCTMLTAQQEADKIDEKIGDAICYLILLEAVLKE